MKIEYILRILIICTIVCSVSSCTKKEPISIEKETIIPEPSPFPEFNPPIANQYILQGSMRASQQLNGKKYIEIHKYMHFYGWDYSEHPNSSNDDHKSGVHCEVIYDNTIKQYVFTFTNHANSEILDGDRGKIEDRQRNEMKSQTSSKWYKLNGNWEESFI